MSKHTPGPWACVSGAEKGAFMVYLPSDGMVICSRNPYEDKHAEFLANARLIAAAPELLSALKSAEYSINITRACILDSVETHGTHGGWLHQEALRLDSELDLIRFAIAKATGAAP